MILKSKKAEVKDAKQEPYHSLYEAILTLKTQEEAQRFFTDLCTPAELQAITDRWQVVGPIKAGVPYRTIYDQMGVSVTTVGRVARSLNQGTGGYDLAWDRLQKSETKTKK